jgi:hypothetical protein
MNMNARSEHDRVTTRVEEIMKPFAKPWRWFRSDKCIVLEPPYGLIDIATMKYIHQLPDTHTIEAVFRATPHPGVYLQFRFHDDI